MAAAGSIDIRGLQEFQAALRAIEGDVDAMLARVVDDVADLTAGTARRKRRVGAVVVLGRRPRPYKQRGRHPYTSLFTGEADPAEILERALATLVRDAGLDVT